MEVAVETRLERQFNLKEAAEILGGISVDVLRKYISMGKVQSTFVFGRRLISESELVRLVNQGRKQ